MLHIPDSLSYDQPFLAHLIAFTAHAAKGQFRADKTTPFIEHPRRVAHLVNEFYHKDYHIKDGLDVNLNIALSAAYLHDVLEDTRLTAPELLELGISEEVLKVVILLTKTNDPSEPEDKEYYRGILTNDNAIFVKVCDRISNIEDAEKEIKASRTLKRWKKYVERTLTEVLPLYENFPSLYKELYARVESIYVLLCEQDEEFFNVCVTKAAEETMVLSNPATIISNQYYQFFLKMNPSILLPRVFNMFLQKECMGIWGWFSMLNILLPNANAIPKNHHGKVHEIKQDWLNWAKENGYLTLTI